MTVSRLTDLSLAMANFARAKRGLPEIEAIDDKKYKCKDVELIYDPTHGWLNSSTKKYYRTLYEAADGEDC